MRERKEDYGVCRSCGLKYSCPVNYDCIKLKIILGTASIANFALKFNPDRKHRNKK